MKKSLAPVFLSFLFIAFMAIAQTGFSQAPPPPPAEKGTNSNKAPSAPIDGGVAMVLAMVAGYGAWKLYKRVRLAK